jgi:ribose/xylose/arabinose/galactoside ABC-type transport system permease subunit
MADTKTTVLGFLKKQKTLAALIVMIIASATASPSFFTFINISNLFLQISAYGIISIGVMLVMLTGAFDISVGSVAAFSGMLTVILTNKFGYGTALAVILPLALIIGVIHGLLVVKVGIHSFVVTLGGMFFYRGMGYLISGAEPITCKAPVFKVLGTGDLFGISYMTYIFIVFILIAQFIIAKTRFGRNVCATGGNYDVAKDSGINADFYKIAVFVICAFTALLAGLLMASRLNRGVPNAGEDASMFAISAVVIGGTNMSGGEGGSFKTLLGVLMMGLITNALNILGISAYYQLAIRGLILITVVCVDKYYRNRDKAL